MRLVAYMALTAVLSLCFFVSAATSGNSTTFSVAPIVPLGVSPGLKIFEKVVVLNNTSTTLHNVQVSDFLPKGVVIRRSSLKYKMLSGHPSWVVKTVGPRGSYLIKMTVQYPKNLPMRNLCHRAKGWLLGTSQSYLSPKFCSQVVPLTGSGG